MYYYHQARLKSGELFHENKTKIDENKQPPLAIEWANKISLKRIFFSSSFIYCVMYWNNGFPELGVWIVNYVLWTMENKINENHLTEFYTGGLRHGKCTHKKQKPKMIQSFVIQYDWSCEGTILCSINKSVRNKIESNWSLNVRKMPVNQLFEFILA